MRISLLLQREPFGEILERTLASFWSEAYGEDFEVCWTPRSLGSRPPSRDKRQRWYANYFINGIFTAEIDEQAFAPLRREFGRSPIAWRDPLQRAYVGVASRLPFAAWLAQAYVDVYPAVPDISQKMIVPGSAKIRILDHVEGTVDVILKDGFDPSAISKEIEARSLAAEYGITVPQIFESDVEKGWLWEQYVLGTPINRLGDWNLAEKTAETLIAKLKLMTEATQAMTPTDNCIQDLGKRIKEAIDDFSERLGEREAHLRALVEQLSGWCSGLARECGLETIPIGLTHGDFQPANILLDGEQLWLIDWERAGRRIAPYDSMVFQLRSRSPGGLKQRLVGFMHEAVPAFSPSFDDVETGIDWMDRKVRALFAGLFLLEELLFHCEENAVPVLTTLSPGLNNLVSQVDGFVTEMRNYP